MRLPAARTAAGTGKAPAVFKHIAALEAFAGSDSQFISLCRQRPGNVDQVLINLLFLNTHLTRQFPGIHLPLGKQLDYLLAYCWHSSNLQMIIGECCKFQITNNKFQTNSKNQIQNSKPYIEPTFGH
jgi:hypothetical protein